VYVSAPMTQKSPVPVYSPGEAATTPALRTLPKNKRKQQFVSKGLESEYWKVKGKQMTWKRMKDVVKKNENFRRKKPQEMSSVL